MAVSHSKTSMARAMDVTGREAKQHASAFTVGLLNSACEGLKTDWLNQT